MILGACVTAFRRGLIFYGRGWERRGVPALRLPLPVDQALSTDSILPGVIKQERLILPQLDVLFN